MPPRKKATTTPAAPTRSSSRTAAKAPPTATAPTPAPTSKSKPKSKRARAASDDEDDSPPAKKPASKKAKVTIKKDEDEDDGATPAKDDKPAKMVTVLKRGAAPVDPMSGKVHTHLVYAADGEVWDAMLNQTNIGENANKFYVLQLLHPNNPSSCVLFTRWGRVGENGQNQTKGPWPAAIAIQEFKKQFKSKAAVNWEDRVGMAAKKGKYTWLERDYGDGDQEDEEVKTEPKEKVKIPDSTLDPEVQDFTKLIFNTSIIDATLSSMNYDARKLPLGKLGKGTILKGFEALKTLSEVISDPNGDLAKSHGGWKRACEDLSNAYYSIIPHEFGRVRPTVINDQQLLKAELELVDALGDMEVATKLISESTHAGKDGNPVNPLDAQFNSLGLINMAPVTKSTDEYNVLEKYVRDTHGHTHGHIKVNIKHIFRLERPGECERWKKNKYDKLGDGERLLLWHGSRSTNFAGILKQGLRIAPPEAPVSGYMFGKGVYFADMMSKSAGYCYPHLSDNTGVLILCEVAAKPFYEREEAEYYADQSCKSSGKLATKGLGRTAPTEWKDAGNALGVPDLNGCWMPDNAGQSISGITGYLQYNEYICYSIEQIRIRYLFMIGM